MKILGITNNKVIFKINEHKSRNIEELNGEDILEILKNIANNKDYYNFEYEKNDIKNDVYRFLVDDLIKQFITFKNNVDNIIKAVDSTFIH